ncbi:hypothetical protein K8R62_01645 [bacterium]|nr:hypothetical protein [bacterium]
MDKKNLFLILLVVVFIFGFLILTNINFTKKNLTIINGEFTTTKGHMGVVNSVLIPYFQNKPEEVKKYIGKIVEVKGYINKYDKNDCPPMTQCWMGSTMDMKSIKIIE